MMKVGDKVTWRSQANGVVKTKTGTIGWVVPAFERADSVLPPGDNYNRRAFDGGWRTHESYIVMVESGCGKPRLYWPRVSALRVVEAHP